MTKVFLYYNDDELLFMNTFCLNSDDGEGPPFFEFNNDVTLIDDKYFKQKKEPFNFRSEMPNHYTFLPRIR